MYLADLSVSMMFTFACNHQYANDSVLQTGNTSKTGHCLLGLLVIDGS